MKNSTLKNYRELLSNFRRTYSSWKTRKDLEREFLLDFVSYNKSSPVGYESHLENLYPCLYDKTEVTEIEPIYFYQDNWAFEKVVNSKPKKHYDIGSHHKYVALLSKVLPVTMIDIRPLSLPVDSITFIQGSLLELPFENSSIDSLSSLCVVEHIGLGRYGDSIDPLGSEKAFKELSRVMKTGGNLYISVPVEKEGKVYFNAHRSFSEEYIYNVLSSFSVVEAKYIYGNKFSQFKEDKFGIGCYHLVKK